MFTLPFVQQHENTRIPWWLAKRAGVCISLELNVPENMNPQSEALLPFRSLLLLLQRENLANVRARVWRARFMAEPRERVIVTVVVVGVVVAVVLAPLGSIDGVEEASKHTPNTPNTRYTYYK